MKEFFFMNPNLLNSFFSEMYLKEGFREKKKKRKEETCAQSRLRQTVLLTLHSIIIVMNEKEEVVSSFSYKIAFIIFAISKIIIYNYNFI